ncbi:hypothetical protein GYMLUDRAFT_44063 [Collybiopsis luxurians FD-317 M1]|uniref:Importin N-terminal domain-containing protein n=1 Tax=Collybiopsis luxurians FD-317 M1 TaxID=944289 RepID=A0A0D0B931_9AGAR|nr:hypothetical protein GYMLUDRAFT_44063 [Collybiopsis luxurians FD-317 M1]
MSDLPQLLLASLDPNTRKQAEQSLNAYSTQTGFLSHLLRLCLDHSQNAAVRLSGSVYLKNVVKSRWEDDVQPVANQDKAALKAELVPAMLALSAPSDKPVRAQVAESVSLIAELDFPHQWEDLIDQLVNSLSPTDYNINLGVLQTGHSIFRQWRPLVRTDKLFTEINLVFSKFMTPFLQLFRQTATLLTQPGQSKDQMTLLAQCMVLLVEVYYDFTCQDLPPAIEDSHLEFFGANGGYFPGLMRWDPVELREDPDSTTPSLPTQIKTSILNVVELFIKLFPDTLQSSSAVETFIQLVWSILSNQSSPTTPSASPSSTGDLSSQSYDTLISQSLRFISTSARSPVYKSIFSSSPGMISSLIEGAIIPNAFLREVDVEMFEDDPMEYVRLDYLAVSQAGTEAATRRQAAADVLQALVGNGEGYEVETTKVVGGWVEKLLKAYGESKKDDEGRWKSKDAAIWLITAVASRGGTFGQGVTSTNKMVDVVGFFEGNVYPDLQAREGESGEGQGDGGRVHPILKVDAIRFLNAFRNQLTKPQLLSVLPLLIKALEESRNYVTYTYAAIAVERILGIRQQGQILFTQTDVRDFAPHLIGVLLTKIERAGPTPEKIAENDHLMRCVMRVIITARQTLTPTFQQVLNRLVAILGVVSKNPSNPKFDQYIFESLSALMRFITAGSPTTTPTFESTLFEPFTIILTQDIDQYIPYVFQLLAQMLSLHPTSASSGGQDPVPPQYKSLLPFLLTPTVWQQKGSIPGLVKLLKAFLARDAKRMVDSGQVGSISGILQQRLVVSKVNDEWGFELFIAVVRCVDVPSLTDYLKPVLLTILNRMSGGNKTDKFVGLFAHFILYVMASNKEGLGPDYIIGVFDSIQPGLWGQILSTFVLPLVPKMPHKDRKMAAVGMTRMLFQSRLAVQAPSVQFWPISLQALIKLFSEPQYLVPSAKSTSDDPSSGAALGLGAITEIDYEEQTAGYQAAYSRLAASESAEDAAAEDPVRWCEDAQKLLGEQFVLFGRGGGGYEFGGREVLMGLLGKGEPGAVRPFVEGLARAGYSV